MRKVVLALATAAVCALSLSWTDRVQAADLSGATIKKGRIIKVTHRIKVQRDPCDYGTSHRYSLQPDRYGILYPYGYDRGGYAYVPGDGYRAGFCLSTNTGPRFHPGWAWVW